MKIQLALVLLTALCAGCASFPEQMAKKGEATESFSSWDGMIEVSMKVVEPTVVLAQASGGAGVKHSRLKLEIEKRLKLIHPNGTYEFISYSERTTIGSNAIAPGYGVYINFPSVEALVKLK